MGRTDFIFGKDGKLWDRADFDEGGKVLSQYALGDGQFLQMIKDGKSVSEKMYSIDVKSLDSLFSETKISGFRNGKEVKAYSLGILDKKIICKDGSKNVMEIYKPSNGEKALVSSEFSSSAKGIDDLCDNIPS
ncbi:MAG: hypothetical protein ACI4CY_04425 [Candidatus Gastranaerophilaceae bacterium]